METPREKGAQVFIKQAEEDALDKFFLARRQGPAGQQMRDDSPRVWPERETLMFSPPRKAERYI